MHLEDTTFDDFLSGRISLYQPRNGYRASIESVILASAVRALPRQKVLELGCGVGTVIYCLMSRVPELEVVGVELQHRYAELAKVNAEINNLRAKIFNSNILSIPESCAKNSFDFVILNPPFQGVNSTPTKKNLECNIAMRESEIGLEQWLQVAIKYCTPKGHLVLIHNSDRLDEILQCFGPKVGNISIIPLAVSKGEKAKRIIVIGTKGSKSPLSIYAPINLHKSVTSPDDKRIYTSRITKVLREGTVLKW